LGIWETDVQAISYNKKKQDQKKITQIAFFVIYGFQTNESFLNGLDKNNNFCLFFVHYL
jgi:hypothetical protein